MKSDLSRHLFAIGFQNTGLQYVAIKACFETAKVRL